MGRKPNQDSFKDRNFVRVDNIQIELILNLLDKNIKMKKEIRKLRRQKDDLNTQINKLTYQIDEDYRKIDEQMFKLKHG